MAGADGRHWPTIEPMSFVLGKAARQGKSYSAGIGTV